MDDLTLKRYSKSRKGYSHTAICNAPFTSINFEQNGNMTVCCYNRDMILGNYPEHSIKDAWASKTIEMLRANILKYDLNGGCKLCKEQLLAGNFEGVHAKAYDAYKIDHANLYPQVFEFEISNTCNLECVMCNGYYSSSIRKNREHGESQISPYDQIFVDQITEFLPNIKAAKFLGGEPFLIDIYYKIWERIVQVNPSVAVYIVTNGTILNQRVNKILEKLNAHITVSVDSLDASNYEHIRQNAKYDAVIKNIEYFISYTKKRGTYMTLAVCPMQNNWKNLPAILNFCNDNRLCIFFNTLIFPEVLSLKSLPAEELNVIIGYLESKTPRWLLYPNSMQNIKNYRGFINQLKGWQAGCA